MSDACPICRANHIGSLLRPDSLRSAYKALVAGKIDNNEFTRSQDKAVDDAIRMQEDVGLGVVTDGEFRRRSWFAGFVDGVEGLTHQDTEFNFIDPTISPKSDCMQNSNCQTLIKTCTKLQYVS